MTAVRKKGTPPARKRTSPTQRPLNLQKEKTSSLLRKNQADIHQLLAQLESAKDIQDLNKFIHFDFPRTVKNVSETNGVLFQLLDENQCFQVGFSKLFRSFNHMELSLGRAQAGVNSLQFASMRKEPMRILLKAASRVRSDLEQVKDYNKELEKLIVK